MAIQSKRRTAVNISGCQPEKTISGDSVEDTIALKKMAVEARSYISSFRWCPLIKELFLGQGTGGVVAVFLAQFSERIGGRDEFLWIIVGDLPSAYLVVDLIQTPAQALRAYCDLMEEWVNAVLQHKPLDGVFPVKAAATVENAEALQKRLEFLREDIVPLFEP
jgi:hypothetical protein